MENISDYVKWGMRLLVFVGVIGSIVIFFQNGVFDWLFDGTLFQSFASSLAVIMGYLVQARMVINNFIPPTALSMLLWGSFFAWAFMLTLKGATLVIRFIYSN